MKRHKESNMGNAGFDSSSISITKSLYDLDPAIRPELNSISSIISRASYLNLFQKILPRIQDVDSSFAGRDEFDKPVFAEQLLVQKNTTGAGISLDFKGHGTILSDGLFYADRQPLDVIVENKEFNVLVSVFNGTSSPLTGSLMASFIDSEGNAILIAKLKIDGLASFSLFQVNLVSIVPKSDVNVTLRVVLTKEGTNEVITQSDSVFDIAALFVLSINSAHVFEARSPRNDSLIFGIGVEPHRDRDYRISNGPQLFLGDHGDGDDILIDLSFTIALFRRPDSVYTFAYYLVNDGDVRSPREAAELAAKISLVFDLFSGGLVLSGNDASGIQDLDPLFGQTKKMSLSVSYDIWYQIVYSVLSFNCNGIVAYDQVFCNGALLIPAIDKGNPLVQTITYEGSDSPIGCGANSKYSITRTLERIS